MPPAFKKFRQWPSWLQWCAGLVSVLLAAFIIFVGHAGVQTNALANDVKKNTCDIKEVNTKTDINKDSINSVKLSTSTELSALNGKVDGIDKKLDLLVEMMKNRK